MGARNYQELIAWQKGMDFCDLVYDQTDSFPNHEQFTLTSQLRRSAISVPSNIAEGEGRGSKADFKRFLWIAHGSLREAETQMMIATRRGYLPQEILNRALDLAGETGRVIHGLIRSLK